MGGEVARGAEGVQGHHPEGLVVLQHLPDVGQDVVDVQHDLEKYSEKNVETVPISLLHPMNEDSAGHFHAITKSRELKKTVKGSRNHACHVKY